MAHDTRVHLDAQSGERRKATRVRLLARPRVQEHPGVGTWTLMTFCLGSREQLSHVVT